MDVEWFSWAGQVQQSKFTFILYFLVVVVRLLLPISFKSALDSKPDRAESTPLFTSGYAVSRAFRLVTWFPALFYWLHVSRVFSTRYVTVSRPFLLVTWFPVLFHWLGRFPRFSTGQVVSGAFLLITWFPVLFHWLRDGFPRFFTGHVVPHSFPLVPWLPALFHMLHVFNAWRLVSKPYWFSQVFPEAA